MKKPVLIFTHGGGRLGNQLINFAHLYSFWLEYKNEIDVINMGVWPYSDLLEITEKNKASVFSAEVKNHKSYLLLNKIFQGILKKNRRYLNQFIRVIHLYYSLNPFAKSIMKGEAPNYLKYLTGTVIQNFNLDSGKSIELIKNKKRSAIAGWPIRDWNLFKKYSSIIRNDMRFCGKYTQIAEDFTSKLRENNDLLVGVFIRRGDYKYWLDGRYYFEISFYKKIMKDLVEKHNDKKICFVVASDDLQNADDFEGLNLSFTSGSKMGGGHFVESLAELALCDIIVSPPSTFAIWAAFIGNKPLLPLYSADQEYNEKDIIANSIFDAMSHPHLSNSIK